MAVASATRNAPLRTAFFLTLVLLAVESAAGFVSHSLALLSDAGHVLTDVVALGLAWFAVEQARRPADVRRSYGYHRVEILVAMVNGATLVVIVAAIAFEAARRFAHPEPVQGVVVVVAALGAVAVNSYIAFRLRGGAHSLGVRSVLLHVLGDLGASVAVLVAGAVIVATGWLPIDPMLSLAIAVLIAWSSVRVVVDTVNILLEGAPRGLDVGALRSEITGTHGVVSVHDLHVWSLSPEQVALSCHVVVDEDQRAGDTEHLIRRLEARLCTRFDIGHTTIQAEACHPCDDAGGHGPGEHNHPHAALGGLTSPVSPHAVHAHVEENVHAEPQPRAPSS
jgi:cobalt-zinc-cadmium efflux system protein